LEDGVEALLERPHRLHLGLRPGARAVEGLVARTVRGALQVVVPLGVEVAVGVDAVEVGDLPVAVVVREVPAPQARGRRADRVVVAVTFTTGTNHSSRVFSSFAICPSPLWLTMYSNSRRCTSVAIHSRACWVES